MLCCAGLAKLFKSIDADGSGTITVEELKKALMDWGHRINDVSSQPHLLERMRALGRSDACIHMSAVESLVLASSHVACCRLWVVAEGICQGYVGIDTQLMSKVGPHATG